MNIRTEQHSSAREADSRRQRRFRRGLFAGISLALLSVCVLVIAAIHHVPLRVTDEDLQAIHHLMGRQFLQARPETYREEVAYIARVQKAVAAAAPEKIGIPFGEPREPADLLRAGRGLCFDRSRTIEKTLGTAGFEVRHIALYNLPPNLPRPTKIWRLATRRDLRSHSVTECLTRRGWVVVDSLAPWMSLDLAGNPLSVQALSAALVRKDRMGLQTPPVPIYQHPFTPVYGLYSRHGDFYPPFTPIPDINWREFLANFQGAKRSRTAFRPDGDRASPESPGAE